jgi:hypothetical protein
MPPSPIPPLLVLHSELEKIRHHRQLRICELKIDKKAPTKSMELEDQGQNLEFLATPATAFCIFLLSRVWILQQCHAGFTLVRRTKGRDRRMTRGSMLRDGTNGRDRWMTSCSSRLRDGTNGRDRWIASSSSLRDGTNG